MNTLRTEHESEVDARRYRLLRALICGTQAEQEEAGSVIEEFIGEKEPTWEMVDKAVDVVMKRFIGRL